MNGQLKCKLALVESSFRDKQGNSKERKKMKNSLLPFFWRFTNPHKKSKRRGVRDQSKNKGNSIRVVI